ncbi:MAG: GspE/PulE family protein [Oscillospiraceae bacterium]|jgi:type IV pilus assembly protein PilB|nr:GspE/PulE family protein [Oscillospiraceae bacterium]
MVQQNTNIRIGDLLVENGFITAAQLRSALEKQKSAEENPDGLKIGDMLLKLGYISETQLMHALSMRLKIAFVDLTTTKIEPEAVKRVPEAFARKHTSVAYKMIPGRIYVATNDPINFEVFDELRISTGMEIFPMLATKSSIVDAINRSYTQTTVNSVVEDIDKEIEAAKLARAKEQKGIDDGNERVENAPVVRLVNSLVENAARQKASDIHVEPFGDRSRVRFRLDGELREQMSVKPDVHNAIVTRFKILGGMNIAEKRIPLDGRFTAQVDGNTLDVRVASIPTVFGEKVVVRLLASSSETARKLTDLGMTDYNYSMYKDIIRTPHGVIVVTGPTGSGKSTTLYATLSEISKPNVNVITVEDPVEKRIDGVNQVQINAKAGMTFPAALRSILRLDPDIIMIGEMRDGETAEIAVRAAITGHLVLSTIHTNDAASTILRLVDMGVPAYMVATSLVGIVAQRLVRLLCPKCKVPIKVTDPDDLKLLDVKEPVDVFTYAPSGCRDCRQTGYSGRTAIHEIIMTSNKIKEVVARGGTTAEIEDAARQNGTKLLRENVQEMVLQGKTTMEELVKATYSV